jgi:hypothetical protein
VSPEPAKPNKRDDLLALVCVLVGAVVAFEGRHVMIGLIGGVACGLGGVSLAVRGGRPIEARGLIVCALLACGGGTLGRYGLEIYQEIQAGQWFAEGAPTGGTVDDWRGLYRTVSILRIVSVAGGLALLLLALVERVRK